MQPNHSSHSSQALLPEVQPETDQLSPYADALRAHFPSREEVLREAKQQTLQRRTTIKKAVTVIGIAVIGVITWVIDPVIQQQELATAVGQQATQPLPDGSVIMLNTNSVAQIEYRLRSRNVRLLQGEAAFNVEHQWRSFTVDAKQTKIRDIGTAFNVRILEDNVQVTVTEGTVEVSAHGVKQVLTKDQSILAHATGLAPVTLAHAHAYTAWQQGKLVFDGMPLSAAVAEIQRYRHAPIVIQNAGIGHLRISGEYDIHAVESLLKTLPLSLGVQAIYQADGKVILGHQ